MPLAFLLELTGSVSKLAISILSLTLPMHQYKRRTSPAHDFGLMFLCYFFFFILLVMNLLFKGCLHTEKDCNCQEAGAGVREKWLDEEQWATGVGWAVMITVCILRNTLKKKKKVAAWCTPCLYILWNKLAFGQTHKLYWFQLSSQSERLTPGNEDSIQINAVHSFIDFHEKFCRSLRWVFICLDMACIRHRDLSIFACWWPPFSFAFSY